MSSSARMGVVGDHDSLVLLLDLIRTDVARTRPELSRFSGLGRNVVSQRVADLIDAGLVMDGALAPSTGGRSPRELRLAAGAGHLLVAELGATSISVALADLTGTLTGEIEERATIGDGPEVILGRVHDLFREVMAAHGDRVNLWGIGIGLPGPVEFRTGRPVAPPIMPGWDGFPVREYFAERFDVPVWVDNDVNVMVLGEVRGGMARGEEDVIYIKVGSGIGAGLVSGGRLHRGAQGCAGDLGHVAVDGQEVLCRCGKLGCLEAVAGGAALARDAEAAVRAGRSERLAALLQEHGYLEAAHIANAARHGDPVAVDLLHQSATRIGEALARMVNFFNPSVVVVGGGVAEAGDAYLAAIRQVVFSRSLPLATRNLRIERSPLSNHAGLVGAALMVVEELMSRRLLGKWLASGTPAGMPQLAGS